MVEKQQVKSTEPATVSPLATDKTYGEKVYDRVFNNLLNFWVNLFAAAAFTQWVAHTRGKVRLPGMAAAENPRVIQDKVSTWLSQKVMPAFKSFVPDKSPAGLKTAADKVTEVLTLQIPGHLTIVPSVWLGAKIKPAFVRHYNHKHYGEAADNDPTILHREAMVEAEPKPTLLGAIVARLGTLPLSFAFATVVGSENNKITKFGKNRNIDSLARYPGLNDMAGHVGEGFGNGLIKAFPSLEKANTRIGTRYDFSLAQKNAGMSGAYNRGVQDLFRFGAIDVAYTYILSAGVHPILRALRKVPGMTYTTRPPVDRQIVNDEGEITKLRAPKNRMGLSNAEYAPTHDAPREPEHEKPSTHIEAGNVAQLDRVSEPHEKGMNA